MGINSDRVAVRGRDVIPNIKTKLKKLSGPESITPFGIAMMAHSQKGQDFLSVTVNGEKIQLLNSKKLTVADALILIGFNPDKLIGRTGKSLKFNINGNPMFVKGEHGIAAEITVNNSPASLDSIISVGDNIVVKPAINGKSAVKRISDYAVNPIGLTISLNGDVLKLVPKVIVNGEVRNSEAEINDGDDITLNEIIKLGQLAAEFNLKLEDGLLLVNGETKDMEYVLEENDRITVWEERHKDNQQIVNIAQACLQPSDGSVLNEAGAEGHIGDKGFVITVNGDKIKLEDNKQYIFVDVFSYIDFDLTLPKGNIVLKLNGRVANFTDNIVSGDEIEIYWEKFRI